MTAASDSTGASSGAPVDAGTPLDSGAPFVSGDSVVSEELGASHPHSALLLPMLAAVFATDALTGLVVVAYGNNYLINVLKAPSAYPAFALGVYGLVKLVTAPVAGRLLDRVRARPLVAATAALELAGLAVILVFHTALGYLAGIAVLSTGISFSWLVLFHLVGTGSDEAERGRATSYMGLVSVTATGSGFGAAALISETHWWQAAFFLGMTLALAATGMILRIPVRIAAAHRLAAGAGVPPRKVEGVLRKLAGLIILVHFGVITATLGVFGPFVLRTLDRSLLEAGSLLVPAAITGGAAMFLSGRLSRPGSRLRELSTLYACFGAACLAMAAVQGPVTFLLFAIPLAAGLGGIQPLLNASLMDVAGRDDSTGTTLGWLFFAEGLGSVIGPVLVGGALEVTGARAVIIGIGIVGLVLAIGSGTLSRRYRL